MPVTSATLIRSAAQTAAAIDRGFDRLAAMARAIGGGTHHLPAMLAEIEQQRHALQERARSEHAARAASPEPPMAAPDWCDACQEPVSAPACGYCAGPVIDAAHDLMVAGETLRATIGWADGQVAELEARWAANRAARASGRIRR